VKSLFDFQGVTFPLIVILFPSSNHLLNEVCRIGEMVLRPARHETAGIAALYQGFVTQQDTKSSRQDDMPN
jgi:hypothetical protein